MLSLRVLSSSFPPSSVGFYFFRLELPFTEHATYYHFEESYMQQVTATETVLLVSKKVQLAESSPSQFTMKFTLRFTPLFPKF